MAEVSETSEPVFESLMLFMRQRSVLGRITHATATRCDEGDCRLVVRDDRGTPICLTIRGGSDAPQALLAVLVAAGFAEEIAQAVLAHHCVRLRRTGDGTTSLDQATSPPTPTAVP